MTQDEAINLAVECGFTITHLGESPLLMASGRNLERFARKLIEMEREACAIECDQSICTAQASTAIRERGDE